AAIRESKREAQGEKREPEEEQPGLQILAVAQQPFWSGLPTPADALSPTTEKGPSSIESVVTSVTEAIERSVRAEFTPAAGAPIDIRVTLPGEALGLAGLRIILTKTTLDVVLERTRSTPSDELLRAARALADRLMTRFSKK